MPLFIFAMLLKAVVEGVRVHVRKPREAKPAPCARIASSLTSSMARMRGVRSPVLTGVECAP